MPKTRKVKKDACPWCGKLCAPGPMKQHLKGCESNPDREGFHITQPTGSCPWCGHSTTLGALATHMSYGCPNRPGDGGDARKTCQFCGALTTLPGALSRHEQACPKNPANPQPVSLGL